MTTEDRKRRLAHWVKDPFSGLSHGLGAVLAVGALIWLIIRSQGKPWHLTSFAIYGGTLVLLYVASALYHTVRVSPRAENALFGLDRAAIYAFIAGTYTPICLLALPREWGWALFGIVWGLAFAGIVIDLISRQRTPDWLQAVLYLATGWVVLVALGPLVRSLPLQALLWLAAGSLLYTIGAVICVKNRPRLVPGVFGPHDLWHVMVLAASVCHYVVMLHLF